MKKILTSSLLAAGAFSMFSACSDDPLPPVGPGPSDICSAMTLTHSGRLLEVGNSYWIIGDDNKVTDVVDNVVGAYDGVGNILD